MFRIGATYKPSYSTLPTSACIIKKFRPPFVLGPDGRPVSDELRMQAMISNGIAAAAVTDNGAAAVRHRRPTPAHRQMAIAGASGRKFVRTSALAANVNPRAAAHHHRRVSMVRSINQTMSAK